MRTRLALVNCCCLMFAALWAGNSLAEQDAPPVLKPTGLPAGNPEQVLPAGAVVHVRAHNLGGLLKSLDEIIVSFVPEKALPPALRVNLAQPMPALAFIGLWTTGKPLTVEQLGAMLGVSLDKPITLSFYPANPSEGFVLSVPMKNPQIFTNLLMNAFAPRKFTLTPVRNGNVYEVLGMNPDLPKRVFVACSEDRAYVCGSANLADALAGKDGPARLDSFPLPKRVMQQHDKEDLTILADPSFIKPLLAQVQNRFSKLPPELIQKFRQEILRGIPPAKRARIEMRLRWQLGIENVGQGLDYLEAIATGTYEVLFGSLAAQAQALDGLIVSLDVGNPLQKVRVLLLSKAIKPAESTQPIPLADVTQALTRIPGARDSISITGRHPAVRSSALMTKWLASLKTKFTEKQLPLDGLARFAAQAEGYKLTQPLEAAVPWTIQASVVPPAAQPAAQPKTLFEYGRSLLGRPPAGIVSVMPAQPEDVIEKHFTEEAKNTNANETNYREALNQAGTSQSLCDASARCQVTPMGGNQKKLVYENIYKSNFGIFGYSEHEFINRKVLHYTLHEGYLFVQQGTSSETTWLGGIGKIPAAPLAPALARLLEQAPADAVSIHTLRVLNALPALIAELSRLEDVVHAELDSYLAQVRKLAPAADKDPEGFQAKLLEIEPPLTLMTLSRNAGTGELYCMLPGNLRYPRPSITPVISGLLKEFSAQAEAQGGCIQYERVADGEYETTLAINTGALALLVKSTVNAYYETYVNDPQGGEKLRKLLMVPGDGQLLRNEVLIYNTLWDALYSETRGGAPLRR